MIERPDWMVPGAKVVIISPRGFTPGSLSLEFTEIERVLKRDLVLTNGQRFNADRPRRSLGSYSGYVEVVPPDDPRVLRAIEVDKRVKRVVRVEDLIDQAQVLIRTWREKGEDQLRVEALDKLAKASANLDLTKEV